MSNSDSGYTTDIVYPSAFGAFQSPIHLAYVGWTAGRAAPDCSAAFQYADLGCGAGLTLCILAECYPEAQFFGVDINPEHIRIARALAKQAGLNNIAFHCASFTGLDELNLPDLDFVGLSGVYSWLSGPMRAACLDFVGRRLTPTGIVFLHYAALPGNVQVDALYTLLQEAARDIAGDSLTRFTGAIEIVSALRLAESRFFRLNPQAAAWLDQLPKQNAQAMAHEVLNAQRASLSVRDVVSEAEVAGLAFVGSAQLELNEPELSIPDPLFAKLSALSPVSREMMLDAVRNTHSRMDVFMRAGAPAAPRPPDFWIDRLDRGPATEARKSLSARAGIDLMQPVYGAILERLEPGAIPLAAMTGDSVVSRFAGGRAALRQLIALKLVHLLRQPYARVALKAPRLSSRLNRMLLEDRIESAGPLPLASPIAGTQLLLPPEDRLALLALTGGDFEAAWQRIEISGQRIKLAGQPVIGAAALRKAAAARAQQIGAAMIARLARFGIVG